MLVDDGQTESETSAVGETTEGKVAHLTETLTKILEILEHNIKVGLLHRPPEQ